MDELKASLPTVPEVLGLKLEASNIFFCFDGLAMQTSVSFQAALQGSQQWSKEDTVYELNIWV